MLVLLVDRKRVLLVFISVGTSYQLQWHSILADTAGHFVRRCRISSMPLIILTVLLFKPIANCRPFIGRQLLILRLVRTYFSSSMILRQRVVKFSVMNILLGLFLSLLFELSLFILCTFLGSGHDGHGTL